MAPDRVEEAGVIRPENETSLPDQPFLYHAAGGEAAEHQYRLGADREHGQRRWDRHRPGHDGRLREEVDAARHPAGHFEHGDGHFLGDGNHLFAEIFTGTIRRL